MNLIGKEVEIISGYYKGNSGVIEGCTVDNHYLIMPASKNGFWAQKNEFIILPEKPIVTEQPIMYRYRIGYTSGAGDTHFVDVEHPKQMDEQTLKDTLKEISSTLGYNIENLSNSNSSDLNGFIESLLGFGFRRTKHEITASVHISDLIDDPEED